MNNGEESLKLLRPFILVVLHNFLLTIFLHLLTAKQYCHEEVADKIGLEWLTGVATPWQNTTSQLLMNNGE
jgi:hypothetical protein